MVEPIVEPLNAITLWAKYNWRCIFAVGNRGASIHTSLQKVSQMWGMPSRLRKPIVLRPKMVRYKTRVYPQLRFTSRPIHETLYNSLETRA
jgi:hypothetical protein